MKNTTVANHIYNTIKNSGPDVSLIEKILNEHYPETTFEKITVNAGTHPAMFLGLLKTEQQQKDSAKKQQTILQYLNKLGFTGQRYTDARLNDYRIKVSIPLFSKDSADHQAVLTKIRNFNPDEIVEVGVETRKRIGAYTKDSKGPFLIVRTKNKPSLTFAK